MKCPKCRYMSFGDGDRCRNCGYEFSLLPADSGVEVAIRREVPAGRVASFDGDAPASSADLGPGVQQGRSAPAALTPPPDDDSQPAIGFDLPLFNDARDDVPLVSGNTPPRPPLAVRRAAPATPRPRIDPPAVQRPAALTFPDPEDAELTFREDETGSGDEAGHDRTSNEAVAGEPVAAAGPRLIGATIDAAITLVIDAAVLYFTLRLCDLPFSEITA